MLNVTAFAAGSPSLSGLAVESNESCSGSNSAPLGMVKTCQNALSRDVVCNFCHVELVQGIAGYSP